MKKYAKIAYIVLILIILIFGFSMYKVSGKNNTNEDVKDKTLSEIEYLENELVNLFNEVNNIKLMRTKHKVKMKNLQNQKMAMEAKMIREMKSKALAIQMVQVIVQEKHQLMVSQKKQTINNTN